MVLRKIIFLALTPTAFLSVVHSHAQSPTSDQIIQMLRPSTRGVRALPAPERDSTPAPATGRAETPSVSLTVQFATGSAQLTEQARTVLNELGLALSSETLSLYRFRVEGHTDTVGSQDYNLVLSRRRAMAVVDYLEHRFGISSARLEPVGMGDRELAVSTPPQTDEPRNRRVHVINLGS